MSRPGPSVVRFGILGAGRIAQRRIGPAIRAAAGVRLCAAASRDIERARSLGPDTAYGTYSALLADTTVDAVFITVHNGLHRELTLQALRAGKHVICEKPLGRNAAECEEMMRAAEETGRHLVEAFMYRYHPQIDLAKDLIGAGLIGEVVAVETVFRFTLNRKTDVRLVPEWGGGSLMDVGCYCVNASRFFLGDSVRAVTGTAELNHEGGVDISFVGTIGFQGGRLATISCGFNGGLHQRLSVVGAKGTLAFEAPFITHAGTPRIQVQTEGESRVIIPRAADPYQLEVEDLARAIVGGSRPRLDAMEGLLNARIIEALAGAARANVGA